MQPGLRNKKFTYHGLMGSRFLRTSVQVLRKMANVGKALVQSLVEMKVDPTVSERDSGKETAALRSKSSTSPSKHILALLTHLVR